MSEIFKNWLKNELNGLVNVRTSVTRQQPDLLVHLWSGVQVRIYLINQTPRLRHLKSLLQEASNIGVGSLFLIHESLIPENNTRTPLDEWVLALHELTYEQMYVYKIEKSQSKIFPVHFESVAGTAKYEVHHGPNVQLHRLRFYSRHINARVIRGKWLVADFDTPAFWKDNDYRHQRMKEQAERRKRDSRDTYWHTWSTGRTWQVDDNDYRRQSAYANTKNHSSNGAIKTYLEQCYTNLGVKTDASKDEVKSAFRKLAIELHPDTSELPKEEAEMRFKALSEAYDYIKTVNDWS